LCLYYTTRHRARNRSCTERSESGQSVGSDSLPPVALAGAAVTLWAGFFHGFRRPHRAGNLRSRIQAAACQFPALTVFWTTSKLRTFKRVSKHYPQDCKTPLCSRRRRVDLPGLFVECEGDSTTPSMSQQSPVCSHGVTLGVTVTRPFVTHSFVWKVSILVEPIQERYLGLADVTRAADIDAAMSRIAT